MDNLGETIKKLRTAKKLPLGTIAVYLDIDQAILSKIEKGHGTSTREQLVKLAAYFRVKESDLLVSWPSDKLLDEVADEGLALKALQVAEERLAYNAFIKKDKKDIIKQLKDDLKKFIQLEKAWIYGSFFREDDSPKVMWILPFKQAEHSLILTWQKYNIN